MAAENNDGARTELTALVEEIRDRVRARYPAPGASHRLRIPLPDMVPLAQARDAAEAKVASIGSVNPRRGGPLNSMVLNLDLLKTSLSGEKIDEQLAAKRTRYLGALAREIERLNQTLTAAVTAVKETG